MQLIGFRFWRNILRYFGRLIKVRQETTDNPLQ
ncbi:hypothetical protein SAMN05216325_1327 [Nitrosomonas marina]|uniref:Uncharacterized protein n=1 Tax=Nitrosomonas marina TaxID=917 RepID=A0A1H8IH27_9PROT|nr:hypothetical protein SAMN05216325_1327 [Nitrosomonas marina]